MGVLGNRGKCAQPCRLPYELVIINSEKNSQTDKIRKSSNQKGYLLSTKDLCGLEYLPELIKSGVMCFKIEGRMKTPEYVATVTRIYRKYIDLALSDKPYVIDEVDKKDLLQVFNRGGFSCGHLSSEPNKDLVYSKKPNHMGIYLGNVSNVKPNKGHVFLNLNDTLSIGDTIMFEKENSKYTVSEIMIKNKNLTIANKKQLVEIGRMKGNINIGDKIYKVASKELTFSAKSSYQGENIKIPLEANIILKKDKPILLTVKTLENEKTIYKDICVSLKSDITPVEANSKPIDKDRVILQLSKTNNTIYDFEHINVDLDENLFIPSISILNELRRSALEQITLIAKERILRKAPSKKQTVKKQDSINKILPKEKTISLLLNELNENYNYAALENVDKIYLPLKFFANKKYEDTINTISNKFATFIFIPPIEKSNYFNILNNTIENSIDKFNIKGFVVSNISSMIFIEKMKKEYKDRFEYIANYNLNAYNQNTISNLESFGISTMILSPELDKEAITSICNTPCNIKHELIVYGNTPLMNINYCLLGCTNKCYPTCGTHCMDKDCKYYLKDRLGLQFRIIPDSIQTVSTIYNSKITSISGKEFNVNSYRIDILSESIDEINNIINTAIDGNRLEGKEYTNGNLNKEI